MKAGRRWTGRQVIADILRAAAMGYAVDGDPERAKVLRKRARWLDGREGPGEPYRKHRKTTP